MNMPGVEVNKQAPDFAMADFNGKEFRLSDYKGKSSVLIVLNRGFI